MSACTKLVRIIKKVGCMRPIDLTEDQRHILDNLPDPVVIYDRDGLVQYVNSAFERRFGWLLSEVVGQAMDFVPQGTPSGLTGAHIILQREDAFLTPDTQRVTKDGTVIDVQINTSLLIDSYKKPAGSIVIMRDITERKRAEQAEHEQRTFAEALADVTSVLTSTLKIQEVLDRILLNVGRVVPHDLALIDIVENGIARVVGCRDYTGGGLEARVTGLTVHVKNLDYLHQMAQDGQPIIIADFDQKNPPSELAAETGLRSYLGAPIVSGEELIGFINLQARPPGFFSPSHAEKLLTFAKQAAIAILNARQYEQARELATLNERQRLARDLHDAVSQTLFSASITAETLMFNTDAPPDVQEGLQRLVGLTKGALAEMRTLLLELRPESLVKADLSEILRHLTNTIAGRKNLHIQLESNFHGRLSPDVQLAFYRIAQEALNNIAKHSRAQHISVGLFGDSDNLTLSISDDGIGFDVEQTPGGHFGLANIRERAAEMNADLNIYSEPGQGTVIRLQWMT